MKRMTGPTFSAIALAAPLLTGCSDSTTIADDGSSSPGGESSASQDDGSSQASTTVARPAGYLDALNAYYERSNNALKRVEIAASELESEILSSVAGGCIWRDEGAQLAGGHREGVILSAPAADVTEKLETAALADGFIKNATFAGAFTKGENASMSLLNWAFVKDFDASRMLDGVDPADYFDGSTLAVTLFTP